MIHQCSFIYLPIRATHIHSTQKDIPQQSMYHKHTFFKSTEGDNSACLMKQMNRAKCNWSFSLDSGILEFGERNPAWI